MLDSADDPIRRLRDAFGTFASGVTVVTLRDGSGRPTGITINSFSSLSLDPPLLMFSVGCQQASCRLLEVSDHFVVNVLAADQQATAWQFAKPLKDKFHGVPWQDDLHGMPVLEGALARFSCRRRSAVAGGDHRIIIGDVVESQAREGDPLLFFRGQMRQIEA